MIDEHLCMASGFWCQHAVRFEVYRRWRPEDGWIKACTFHKNRLVQSGAKVDVREYEGE